MKNTYYSQMFYDNKAGFGGVIAIDRSTHRDKKSLGGCRLLYTDFNDRSLNLCRELARCMNYKSALYDLPYAGAKSILCIKNPEYRQRALESFTRYVNQLKGNYIVAVDIGTSVEDMNFLSERTSYISCHSTIGGDPSAATAQGIFYAIEAANETIFENRPLSSLRIAIQGLGKVGSALANKLIKSGAHIIATDIDFNKQAVFEEQINWVSPNEFLTTSCDILVPCAHENFISLPQVSTLNTRCIIPAANLAVTDDEIIESLHQHGIYYLPDYLVNAGGLMQCIDQYDARHTLQEMLVKIKTLTKDVIGTSLKKAQTPTCVVLNDILIGK